MSWRAILCADWAVNPRKREVYVARVAERMVDRLPGAEWTLPALLQAAGQASPSGATLVGIDVPLGVPRGLARAAEHPPAPGTFLDWLVEISKTADFFSTCPDPSLWSPLRPFFSVPAGEGGRSRWFASLRSQGVHPLRQVDAATNAKSLFILSGIPGTVGSGARSAWRELTSLLQEADRAVVWPFDGSLEGLRAQGRTVLAEIYPRAAYALALDPRPPAGRARLALAKTDPSCRAAAIRALHGQPWVQAYGVRLLDLDRAEGNEDAFDAMMSAAGLLRCVLEDTPLGSTTDPFEGGILGLDSLNLNLAERTLSWERDPTPSTPRRAPAARVPRDEPEFPCPIEDCQTVFRGTRGG
jgi:hypothetical protein